MFLLVFLVLFLWVTASHTPCQVAIVDCSPLWLQTVLRTVCFTRRAPLRLAKYSGLYFVTKLFVLLTVCLPYYDLFNLTFLPPLSSFLSCWATVKWSDILQLSSHFVGSETAQNVTSDWKYFSSHLVASEREKFTKKIQKYFPLTW